MFWKNEKGINKLGKGDNLFLRVTHHRYLIHVPIKFH